MNHFELFGLPESFVVDTENLSTRYRALQQKYHPDQGDFDAQEALRLSTLINQAYDTLRLADRRAAYMLQLKGQAFGLEQSIADLDFLQNALELREQLDEASTGVELDSLSIELKQWLDALSREFLIDFEDEDWAEARDTTRKLAFMQRVLTDVERAHDRFDDWDEDLDHDF